MEMAVFNIEVTGRYHRPIKRQAAESVKLEQILRTRDDRNTDVEVMNNRVDFHQPSLKRCVFSRGLEPDKNYEKVKVIRANPNQGEAVPENSTTKSV